LFKNHHFNEFLIKLDGNSDVILKHLLKHNILGGIPLKDYFPELGECLLVATTEVHSQNDYNNLSSALADAVKLTTGGGQ
jgi:glycine dehydrogenase subunit 1